MILSGNKILEEIEQGRIQVEPFDQRRVNPGSYDVTLGPKVAVYAGTCFYRGRAGVPMFGSIFGNDRRRLQVGDESDREDGSGLRPIPVDGWEGFCLDSRKENPIVTWTIPETGWVLKPGISYLAHTSERISTDSFVPIIDGKALALDTDIPTPDGWKTMAELKVGDFVYGSDGLPTEVVATTAPMMNRPCYAVCFLDGTRIVADAEHRWLVHPVDAKPAIKTTAQMAARKARKGRSIFRVPSVSLKGEEVALPIAPYTLGAWLGDGTSCSANITLHDCDPQILDEIRKDGYSIEPRAKKSMCHAYIIGRRGPVRGESGSLHSKLREIGVLNFKHIPNLYKSSSFQQRWALLQGLMDTDGTVHRDDQASITLTNRLLFEDVEELCRSLGIVTSRDERPAKLNGRVTGTAYRLTWRATPELFRLDRKRNRVRSTPKWLHGARHPLRGITSIEPIESVPVRCISVAAADGLFLASRALIQTHNSSIGRLFIKIHETAGYGDAGFDGQFTLEVTVQIPVRVYPGMRIGQVRFNRTEGEVTSYKQTGTYQGEAAQGPVPSRAFKSAFDR